MMKNLIIDCNVFNRIKKNLDSSFNNLIKHYPTDKYELYIPDFSKYEYLGLQIPPPQLKISGLKMHQQLLTQKEKDNLAIFINEPNSARHRGNLEIAIIKSNARLHYSSLIQPDLIEQKFYDSLANLSGEFIKSKLMAPYSFIHAERKSLAQRLVEQLTSDFVIQFDGYSSKEIKEWIVASSLWGAGYEILSEQRNIGMLRNIKKFWRMRDRSIQNEQAIDSNILEEIERSIGKISSNYDYADLDLLFYFLIGHQHEGKNFPVTILTQDKKEQVLGRLIVAFSLINQAVREASTYLNIDRSGFSFNRSCEFFFMDNSCIPTCIFTSMQFMQYLEDTNILRHKRNA